MFRTEIRRPYYIPPPRNRIRIRQRPMLIEITIVEV